MSRSSGSCSAAIAPESIVGLREGYETVFKTDQPTNELYLWLRGKRKQVYVYGSLRDDQEALAGTPTAFLRAFNAIVNFTPEATPWLPDQIEILIWPFEYSVE